MTADVTGLLADIVAPTLVMCGEEDLLTPLDMGPDGAGARYMAEHIPDAELAIMPGGHGYLVEDPTGSARTIIDFLLA